MSSDGADAYDDTSGLPRSSHGKLNRKKVVPLAREHLDGRSLACRNYNRTCRGIAADLGGDLSTVQEKFVESFAGIWLQIAAMNARLLAGEEVDTLAHSTAVSTLVRVGTRLGMHRRT